MIRLIGVEYDLYLCPIQRDNVIDTKQISSIKPLLIKEIVDISPLGTAFQIKSRGFFLVSSFSISLMKIERNQSGSVSVSRHFDSTKERQEFSKLPLNECFSNQFN